MNELGCNYKEYNRLNKVRFKYFKKIYEIEESQKEIYDLLYLEDKKLVNDDKKRTIIKQLSSKISDLLPETYKLKSRMKELETICFKG
ncbi:MAG: hypothetical protein GF329_01375 [Candidatus Lokiarchaeota archaeon]|nr:hypothetical protein [Candidatus Lokiarchaeota archaeon]